MSAEKTVIENKPSVYFSGLNGLRFFAAFAVILTHLELLKDQQHLKNLWKNPFFFNSGGLGVYFFFVLSGFLITYLLLAEQKATGTIGVKEFYLRRVFRIWPVYYLLVVVAFFILPQFEFLHIPWLQKFIAEDYWFKFFLYCLLLPNLALAMYPAIPHAGQSWSIGVEEQFYILWPWMVKKAKNVVRAIVVFTGIVLAIKVIVLVFAMKNPDLEWLKQLKKMVAMSKFESMSIGAIGAWVLFEKKEKWLQTLYRPEIQIACYAMIPVLMFFTPQVIQDGIHLVYSVVFLIIILNVCSNPRSFLKLKNPIIDYLGKISYGIYMYHMIVVVFCIQVCKRIFPDWTGLEILPNMVLYISATLLTFMVSALSYEWFEKRFIKMKEKFSKVISGDLAKK